MQTIVRVVIQIIISKVTNVLDAHQVVLNVKDNLRIAQNVQTISMLMKENATKHAKKLDLISAFHMISNALNAKLITVFNMMKHANANNVIQDITSFQIQLL